jgi:(S)-citramalyl-CoA lyase
MSDAAQFQPRRSLIFIAGTAPEMFPKALASTADIVCIDLEDAVAPQDKDTARTGALGVFDEPQAQDGVERIVRINPLRTPEGIADLSAICAHATPPPALMMTKARSPEDVRVVAELLDSSGHTETRLHVIVETNDALDTCYALAQASPRIDSILFGGVDMAAELRVEPSWEALVHARARVVHAASGAGVDLIDVPFLDLEDQTGLEREAAASCALGFTGKAAIHPKQIPVLNTTFSPSAEMVERARQIIDAFERADTGLVVFEGRLLERPVLRSMYRTVAIAEQIERRN